MKRKGTKVLGILLSLALVLGLMPGMNLTAYAAPTEELLTTITATAKEQASYSVENIATVSFSYSQYGSSAYHANWGWWGYGWTATVAPVDGYTITKCVFYDDANRTATDSEAPFVVETTEEDKTPQVNGTPIKANTSKGIKKIEVYGYAAPASSYSVTITPGSNMTKTEASGAESQTDLSGAMADVVYAADDGYYFPEDYSVAAVNGISVTRNGYTQITVSGTPTADATITLTAPTAKTKPDAPTTAAAVDCTTADNNDGKLTGVTTAMEYKKSDADSWTDGTGSDITGLVPGTYYVRVKATDTTSASDNQVLTIAPAHIHSFTYSADGATITATCTAGCPDSYDTTPAILTIAAAGGIYDGTTVYSATVTNNIPAVTGDTVGSVAYYKVDTEGATTGGTAQAGAPTGAGYYYASVTLTSGSNTYTAVKAFTVAKADVGTPTVTMSGYKYGETPSTPSISANPGNAGVTYYYNTVDSTTGGTEWTGITATSLNANTYYMYAVIAATDSYNGYTTATTSFTVSKGNQTAPAAPTAASVSTNSITLNSVEGCEYRIGEGEWTSNTTFTGLTMNTSYSFSQRLKETANYNPSSSSSANISTSNHVHNWSYEAGTGNNANTITATCGNTDGGHGTPLTATLTISATNSTYTGNAYTGASLDSTAWTAAGLAVPTIEYSGRGTTSYTKSTTAPTNVGDYTASVTVDGKTASADFAIGKADPGTPAVTMSGYTYGGTVSTPGIGAYSGGGAVTYYYNTANSTSGGTQWTGITATSLNAKTYYIYAVIAPTNNYNGYTTATTEFTIAKATVTVTAEAKSKTYGEATDPDLTYTYSGLLGSDTLTGELSRETGENAGTYAIGQGTLTAGDNYTINYTGANFTINQAAITITADDKSGKFGTDLAALTYTVSGAYKAGDELGVTLNTTATKTSDVGEYPITVGWNGNTNYTATLVDGKYTITQTDLTVTATGYTGVYDGAAHGITVDVGSSGATVYYGSEALTAENYTTAGSTTALTYTDAGENTVYFYVVSKNYKPDTVSGSKTVSISKATMTKDDLTNPQKPTAKADLIADNTDQVLLTAPTALPTGYTKIQYSIDNGATWTDAIPTGKDPGETTVLTKYVGDKNHADFEGEAVTATIKTLTVTFEVNGGSAVAAQNVIKGEKAQKPADPTKDGNAFDGWFQDATFSVAFDFDKPITASTTAYAKWTPNDYTFQSITGTTTDASHSWTKGSGKDAVITVKLATAPDNSFAHYVRTEIDGKTVPADAREGSTIVTIKAAELQKLSTGAHTVTIVFDNGSVDVKLTVKPNPSSPATGDARTTGLWATLTILSGLGIGGVTVLGKKRRKAARR